MPEATGKMAARPPGLGPNNKKRGSSEPPMGTASAGFSEPPASMLRNRSVPSHILSVLYTVCRHDVVPLG